MSARDLILPERAMAGLLNKMFRSIDSAERNFRYPGAVRFAENVASAPLSLGLVANNVLSLTLDRGRWFLVGGSLFNTTGVSLQTWDLNLAFSSTSIAYPDVRTQWQEYETGRIMPLFLTHSISLDEAETINLQARAFAGGAGTVAVTQTYFIAVPV